MTLLTSGCAPQQPGPRLPVQEQDQPESPFDRAAERPPTVKTLYVMSRLYAGQGKDVEAEGVLLKVIEESPDFIPAYCDLAEVQLRLARPEDAIRTLQCGLRVAPNDAVLLNDLGMCQLLRRDYDAALRAFTRASEINPKDVRYRSNTAVALGMLGRYEEALAAYSQVLSPADAHYNLGVICESRNDQARAAQEFRKSIELQDKERASAAAASKARVLREMASAGAAARARPAAQPTRRPPTAKRPAPASAASVAKPPAPAPSAKREASESQEK